MYSQVCNAYEKLEFDFGENALKTAITSKEGSRCANYSIGQEPEIVTKNKKNHFQYEKVYSNEFKVKRYLRVTNEGQVWCQQPR